MRLKQILGQNLLSEHARQQFENASFSDLGNARVFIQRKFPNHVVHKDGNRIVVANKDRSFHVAVFKTLESSKTLPW